MFDVLPRVHEAVNGVNFLERLWAYLTIRDLLERVAKGDLNSCPTESLEQRQARSLISDDEDYDNSGSEGSGDDEYYYYVEGEDESNKDEDTPQVEDIMDVVGDEDFIICDNIERALYLSLKYEFVTPLTSLVVVKPDEAPQEGDLSEAGHGGRHISIYSSGPPNALIFKSLTACWTLAVMVAIPLKHILLT